MYQSIHLALGNVLNPVWYKELLIALHKAIYKNSQKLNSCVSLQSLSCVVAVRLMTVKVKYLCQ